MSKSNTFKPIITYYTRDSYVECALVKIKNKCEFEMAIIPIIKKIDTIIENIENNINFNINVGGTCFYFSMVDGIISISCHIYHEHISEKFGYSKIYLTKEEALYIFRDIAEHT